MRFVLIIDWLLLSVLLIVTMTLLMMMTTIPPILGDSNGLVNQQDREFLADEQDIVEFDFDAENVENSVSTPKSTIVATSNAQDTDSQTFIEKKLNKIFRKLLLVSKYQKVYANAMQKSFNETNTSNSNLTNAISSLPFEIVGSFVGLMMGALAQFQQRFQHTRNQTLNDLMSI